MGGYTQPPTSTRLPRYSATLHDIITRDLIDIIYQQLVIGRRRSPTGAITSKEVIGIFRQDAVQW